MVTIATSRYDGVYTIIKETGRVADQCLADLIRDEIDQPKSDCELIRAVLRKYDVTDTGPNNVTPRPGNMYTMENNPTIAQYNNAIDNIKKRVRELPDKNFLIVFCVAGYSMQIGGHEVVLVNEFDGRSTFYKFCSVEKDVRLIAELFKNTYQIVIFACRREVFNRTIHCGGISKAEANKMQEEDQSIDDGEFEKLKKKKMLAAI